MGILEDHFSDSVCRYEALVKLMTEDGLGRKQAREAARSVMPNATETKIVISGNHRAWREVIAKRNSPHADAEIHELASQLLIHLKKVAPNSYRDMI